MLTLIVLVFTAAIAIGFRVRSDKSLNFTAWVKSLFHKAETSVEASSTPVAVAPTVTAPVTADTSAVASDADTAK